MALETLVENITNAVRDQSGEGIDMKRLFGGFTMDTIIQVSYGIRVDSLNDDNPIIYWAKKAFRDISLLNVMKFILIFGAPKLAKFLKLRVNADINDYFKEFSKKIIDERKKDLAELTAKGQPFKATNFLDFMIEAENAANTEEEMDTKCKF